MLDTTKLKPLLDTIKRHFQSLSSDTSETKFVLR
jgi:hypothetical protein